MQTPAGNWHPAQGPRPGPASNELSSRGHPVGFVPRTTRRGNGVAEPDAAGRVTAGPTGAGLGRWVPGVRTFRHYRRGWLAQRPDGRAGPDGVSGPCGDGVRAGGRAPPDHRAVRNHRAAAGVRGVRPFTGDGAGARLRAGGGDRRDHPAAGGTRSGQGRRPCGHARDPHRAHDPAGRGRPSGVRDRAAVASGAAWLSVRDRDHDHGGPAPQAVRVLRGRYRSAV